MINMVDFLKILVSDKYIKVYKDTYHLMSGFTILLFIVQIISFSFFIQIALSHFGYVSKTDWILFLRIFTFFGVFVDGAWHRLFGAATGEEKASRGHHQD